MVAAQIKDLLVHDDVPADKNVEVKDVLLQVLVDPGVYIPNLTIVVSSIVSFLNIRLAIYQYFTDGTERFGHMDSWICV